MSSSTKPSARSTIIIRGARTHNLRGVDLDLPRDKLIVITGLSPGATVTAQVRAKTDTGEGNYTAPAQAVTHWRSAVSISTGSPDLWPTLFRPLPPPIRSRRPSIFFMKWPIQTRSGNLVKRFRYFCH